MTRCVASTTAVSTGMGKLVFGTLGAVAEFVADIRKERQLEGIAKAKAAGVYRGRKPSVDVRAVKPLRLPSSAARGQRQMGRPISPAVA